MQASSERTNLTTLILAACILFATYFITKRYIVPIAWAGIISISTWPWYTKWLRRCRSRSVLAAFTFTLLLVFLLLVPLTWITIILAKEMQTLTHFMIEHNKTGIPSPTWITQLPIIGSKLNVLWTNNLSHPQFIQQLSQLFHSHYHTLGSYIKVISAKTIYHSISFFFCMLTVFFFYKDGLSISKNIEQIGLNILPHRWNHYFSNLANAIRGVVNGTVLTGLGVGIIMSFCYTLTKLPFPALFGLATALCAMVPFGITIILALAIITLIIKGSYIAAIITLIIGGLVNFISDHIIKPNMISQAIELPFLMILLGIIGGIETLGIIGLFIGPIIMVLFYKLFLEYT